MISRIWNTYIKFSIRDISVRLQGLTSVEHYFEDAFTRYQMRLQDLTGLEH